jgi:hypothetical protein
MHAHPAGVYRQRDCTTVDIVGLPPPPHRPPSLPSFAKTETEKASEAERAKLVQARPGHHFLI